MVINKGPLQSLSQIAAFLKVPAGKIGLNEEASPTRVLNKNITFGYFNIICQLLQEAKSNLGGSSHLDKTEVRQWIEYVLVYTFQLESAPNRNHILKELNSVLETRTYLVPHKFTIADVLLYYNLHSTMESLTMFEKEKFIHVSRYFKHIQHDPQVRQSNKVVDFSALWLASRVPLRH